MRKGILHLAIVVLAFVSIFNKSFASDKIKIYFNTPVNTASSNTGVDAIYVKNKFADTIIAYINRAKYSVDIAQYDYNQNNFSNIATAVNNAYARGVNVRWLYDATEPNDGLSLLNSNIDTYGRPGNVGGGGIMHNKFIIIDANSANPADAILCTGSEDWGTDQLNYDFNNILFIQDSALAHAYTDEFNVMWGSTTLTHNAQNAKFGNQKSDLGRHSFYVDGTYIELYFSPSDNTNSHIIDIINSATKELYFGVYTFTETSNANAIVTQHNKGIYTAGIVDQYTPQVSSSVDNTLKALGDKYIVYNGGDYIIYHSKMMIVDPNTDSCGNSAVLTGSHNWTLSADRYNDENTLVIHNDTIANVYYQWFHGSFTSLGGTLAAVSCAGIDSGGNSTSAIPSVTGQTAISVFPNPATESTTISYNINTPANVTITVFNSIGQQVAVFANNELQNTGDHKYIFTPVAQGVYIARFTIGNDTYTKSIIKL